MTKRGRHMARKKRAKKAEKAKEWEAFCVKCRKKVKLVGAEVVTLKNNRLAVKGTCPNCGTTVYRFISPAEAKA